MIERSDETTVNSNSYANLSPTKGLDEASHAVQCSVRVYPTADTPIRKLPGSFDSRPGPSRRRTGVVGRKRFAICVCC